MTLRILFFILLRLHVSIFGTLSDDSLEIENSARTTSAYASIESSAEIVVAR
jgi:hypothetical protein